MHRTAPHNKDLSTFTCIVLIILALVYYYYLLRLSEVFVKAAVPQILYPFWALVVL